LFRQPSVRAVPSEDGGPEFSQFRVGMTWSPADRMRGIGLLDEAEAECLAGGLREELLGLVEQGMAYGRPAAHRGALEVLERELGRIGRSGEAARQRLERHVSTVPEVDAIESRVSHLLLGREDHRIQLAEVEGKPELGAASLETLLQAYERASIQAEQARSRQRAWDAWRVELRGGAVAWPQTDWYASATARWSIGGLDQGRAEREVLAARVSDLSDSKDELRQRVVRFRTVLRDGLKALEMERAVIVDRAGMLRERMSRTPDREAFTHFREVASLDLIELEARQVYVESLISSRKKVLEGDGQ
jgi:hypothetical protein